MTRQIKLAFELNTPCPQSGVIYTGRFLEKLDLFINESGIVVMHKEDGHFTKNDFIGIATGYNILKDKFIIITMNIINERYHSLQNVDGYLNGLPKVVGTVSKSGIADVEKIERIEVIV